MCVCDQNVARYVGPRFLYPQQPVELTCSQFTSQEAQRTRSLDPYISDIMDLLLGLRMSRRGLDPGDEEGGAVPCSAGAENTTGDDEEISVI